MVQLAVVVVEPEQQVLDMAAAVWFTGASR
jgi:hypothetical protein